MQGTITIRQHGVQRARYRHTTRIRNSRKLCLKSTAEVADLDDKIQIWSPPIFKIACLSGDCLDCDEVHRWRNKQTTDWQQRARSYAISYVDIHLGGRAHILDGDRTDEMYQVGRAMARIISGGSDAAFCATAGVTC